MDGMFCDALLQADWIPRGAFELPYKSAGTRGMDAQGGDPIEQYQLSLLLVGLNPTTYPCLKVAVSHASDSTSAASSLAGPRTTPSVNSAAVDYVSDLFSQLRTARPDPLALVGEPEGEVALKRTFTLAYRE